MGCVFCATGQMGFKRHLSSGEIVAQVMYYALLLHGENKVVTNVVLMGMGEPFHNYDNTMAAIDRLNDPAGIQFWRPPIYHFYCRFDSGHPPFCSRKTSDQSGDFAACCR